MEEFIGFPPWSEGIGLLHTQSYNHPSRPSTELPDYFYNPGHLGYSPVRGVIEEESVRHRLGITVAEAIRTMNDQVGPELDSRYLQEVERRREEAVLAGVEIGGGRGVPRMASDDEREMEIVRSRMREVGIEPPAERRKGLSREEIERASQEVRRERVRQQMERQLPLEQGQEGSSRGRYQAYDATPRSSPPQSPPPTPQYPYPAYVAPQQSPPQRPQYAGYFPIPSAAPPSPPRSSRSLFQFFTRSSGSSSKRRSKLRG